MHKIERNLKLYAYSVHCAEIQATVELATSGVLDGLEGHEAIITVDSAAMLDSATARVFICINPNNKSQPKVKLLGFLSAPYDYDQGESAAYWEKLFESIEFRFDKRSSYSLYLFNQIKAMENHLITEDALHSEQISRMDAQIAELCEITKENECIINYAKRYGILSREFLEAEAFSAVSDNVFVFIPMYGVHSFTLKDKFSQSSVDLLAFQGTNKYTSDKVVLNCIRINSEDRLVFVDFQLGANNEASHWYRDTVDISGIPHYNCVVATPKEAVLHSIQRDILVLKKDRQNKINIHKQRRVLKCSAIEMMIRNKAGHDSVLRIEEKS